MTYNGFLQGSTQVYAPMLFKNQWGYDSALYVQNVGSSDATVTIEFYDATTGNLTCTKTDRITPLASKGYWLPDMSCTPAMPSSWYGAAVITSDQDVVAVGRPHLGSEVMTYNGFLQGSTQVYAPMLFKNQWGYDSALYVQNVGSSDATVTIEFYDATTGNLTCTKTDRITPLASKGYWLPDMSCTPAMPSSWYGAAVITSDQDVVAVGRPHLGSEVMTYNGFLQGSTQVYAPMLFKNQWGYDSALYVQNVGSSDATVTIEFYDATTGNLTCTKTDRITPLASKGYWLPDMSCTPAMPSSWYGAAVITSDQDVVAVGRPHLGSEVMTYNGFLQGSTQVYAPMLFKNQWGYDSALYVQNVGSSDATVTIEFYDATTGNLTCTKTDRITPLASKGYWLPDMSCTPAMPSSWYGAAVITSDQDVVAVGRPHLGSEVMTYNGFLMQGSMQGNSISGRVTDSQGTGMPDVAVEVYDSCDSWWWWEYVSYAYTDADGYYTVMDIPTGSYLVYFWAGDIGYISEFYNDKSDCASVDTVPVTLTPTTYIDAVLTLGGSISGTVTDSQGNPIAYVEVDVYDTSGNWVSYTPYTLLDGTYTVTGIPTGSYKVEFFDYNTFIDIWYNQKIDFDSADIVPVTEPNTTTGIDAVLD
jgi:acyl-coenzyme A thioesterase PaaI-like protein